MEGVGEREGGWRGRRKGEEGEEVEDRAEERKLGVREQGVE